ncbi:BQ5605_C016g08256 [Microbotryum silenes-dioicae]|uniref:BQ5605_C016g08256 protein n=1 Tax=Microbotryum silenes-dioicae TaxID=796604 RepID=A0A2X0NTB7_9BASI|nr:BQ5605_C016g08256 [Microbotryum silenes-dioicae]
MQHSYESERLVTLHAGRVDFVRLRIRVHGTLNKNRSVNSGSPSRGRSSTARFGGVTVVLTGDPKQCLPVILNGSVRWGDHPVGRGSEAMPSRYSTARFGGVTVALAGDPKQCLPVILNGSVWWRDRRVASNAFPSSSTARFGGVTGVLPGDPKQCLPVILNGAVRWSVEGSEAMPSRYSTARFGGVTVALAGNPKQCLPVILNGAVRWSNRRVGRPATTTARARAFRSGPTQFFAEPCLYRINIDVCEVARGARRRT